MVSCFLHSTFLVLSPLSSSSSSYSPSPSSSSSSSSSSSFPGTSSRNIEQRIVKCGPRSNRGPLTRGRVLSTEAMLAIQALKRAKGDNSKIEEIISKSVSRLIKNDQLATIKELQRQNQGVLALKVFMATRREPWYKSDYSLHAEMVNTLARNGMVDDIYDLISDCLSEGLVHEDIPGLARLLNALIVAGQAKLIVEIYTLMRKGNSTHDEHVYRILSQGLRRLGETQLADEAEKDFAHFCDERFNSHPTTSR